jgi:aminoglycoside 6'-N-acetyltransferase
VVLGGKRVVLRPRRPEDVERLVQISREPEVALWWGQLGATEVGEQFVAASDAFVIEVDGEVIGAIQYGEESDPSTAMRGSTSS